MLPKPIFALKRLDFTGNTPVLQQRDRLSHKDRIHESSSSAKGKHLLLGWKGLENAGILFFHISTGPGLYSLP